MESIRCIKCRDPLPEGSATCPRCHTKALSTVAIGQILVEHGLITPVKLDEVLSIQRHTGRRLGALLTDAGLVDEKEFCRILAEQIDIPFFDLEEYFIDPAVVALLPEPLCERYRVIPLMKNGERLIVAMMDPTNAGAISEIELVTGLEVKVVVATPTQIHEALDQAFDDIARARRLNEELLDDPERPTPLPTRGPSR